MWRLEKFIFSVVRAVFLLGGISDDKIARKNSNRGKYDDITVVYWLNVVCEAMSSIVRLLVIPLCGWRGLMTYKTNHLDCGYESYHIRVFHPKVYRSSRNRSVSSHERKDIWIFFVRVHILGKT